MTLRTLALLLAAACTGAPGADDTGKDGADADTDADTDTDTDTDSGADTDTDLLVVLDLYLGTISGTPLEGAPVTAGDATGVTGADGIVLLEVSPRTTLEVVATPDGYPPLYLLAHSGIAGGQFARAIATEAELGMLAAYLGATYDPTRGILSVNTVTSTETGFTPLAGVTVDIGVAYDLVAVSDSSSAAGYSVGNTTLADNGAFVLFGNVTPGPVTLTHTAPDGYACTLFSGGDAPSATTLTVRAGAATSATFVCDPA